MYIFKLITSSDRTDSKVEITRWVVESVDDSTLDKLREKLKSLFRTRSSRFFMSWFDGEDYCTIREPIDLTDAVDFMTEDDNPDKSIRIFVSPDATEHKTIFGEKPLEELDVEANNEYEEEKESEYVKPEWQEEEQDGLDDDPEYTVLQSFTDKVERLSVAGKESETINTNDPDEERSNEEGGNVPAVQPIMPPTAPGQVCGAPMMMLPPNYMYPMYPGFPMGQPGAPLIYPAAPVFASDTSAPPAVTANTSATQTTSQYSEVLPAHPVQPTERVCDSVQVPRNMSGKLVSPQYPIKSSSKDGIKPSQIKTALQTLRGLGYTQDEKFLKRLIKNRRCKLNEIIDDLEKQTIYDD